MAKEKIEENDQIEIKMQVIVYYCQNFQRKAGNFNHFLLVIIATQRPHILSLLIF